MIRFNIGDRVQLKDNDYNPEWHLISGYVDRYYLSSKGDVFVIITLEEPLHIKYPCKLVIGDMIIHPNNLVKIDEDV